MAALPVGDESGAFPRMIQEKLITLSVARREGTAFHEMLMRHCDTMRAGLLAEAQPTMLERMLIERIVTCWLAAYLSDVDAAWHNEEFEMMPFLRRQHNAHKQFISAVEALAKVQRLMRPGPLLTLAQMNIATPGSQQVNMLAQPPAGTGAS